MGVHGLWGLLAPVGRRVSVETLAGKRLAVDASIWMVQFMRAMRDDKGDMVRDAHILGFLRRICKLLFLRARPVFVFDGAIGHGAQEEISSFNSSIHLEVSTTRGLQCSGGARRHMRGRMLLRMWPK